jgi:hypothetical protein
MAGWPFRALTAKTTSSQMTLVFFQPMLMQLIDLFFSFYDEV